MFVFLPTAIRQEICEIADFTGDSYKLSVDASKVTNKNILMCGVRFMAETCKILSPDKTVYLAQPSAGCQMADQMDKEMISSVKEMYPDYAVVAYINTTADLKTICDVCVTSSSAVKIVSNMPEKNILFIPDCNLGDYVSRQLPDKILNFCTAVVRFTLALQRKMLKRQRHSSQMPNFLFIRSASLLLLILRIM